MYENDFVREAHQRGSQLILGYLLEGGEKKDRDYGVKVVQNGENYFVSLGDLEKAHKGVEDLLRTLQLIKARGDADAATRLFDRFGSRVNPEWRRNIRARAARLKLPNKTAFVFPRLEPVTEGDKIADVRLLVDEDLTAQQLRFSRLRFNKQIP
jgi:dipeptidyl-peptidase-3